MKCNFAVVIDWFLKAKRCVEFVLSYLFDNSPEFIAIKMSNIRAIFRNIVLIYAHIFE